MKHKILFPLVCLLGISLFPASKAEALQHAMTYFCTNGFSTVPLVPSPTSWCTLDWFAGQTFAHQAHQTLTVESLVNPAVVGVGGDFKLLNTQNGRSVVTVVCSPLNGAAIISGLGRLVRVIWGNPFTVLSGAAMETGFIALRLQHANCS